MLVDGVPCTSVARTVADCLRHLPPPEAVALADAALRAGFVTVEQITAVLMDCHWPALGGGGAARAPARRAADRPLELALGAVHRLWTTRRQVGTPR